MSGLITADIDMARDEGEKVKDGWASISDADLEDTLDCGTFTYVTLRGGDHYIFADPGDIPLGPTQNHITPDGIRLQDVDRRAGSSYFIAWGNEVPADRSAFKPAPAWILTPSIEPEKNPYSGTVEEWLARCPLGEPSSLIRSWVSSIPRDITHQQMIESQRILVAYAVEGEAGVPWALERFKGAYLSEQWDTPKYARAWLNGLVGAIAKYGAFPPGPRDIGLNPNIIDLANGITDAGFTDVWTTLPPDPNNRGAMRDRVAHIAGVALSSGLPLLGAADLAWASAAAREGIRRHLPEAEARIEVWNVTLEAFARPADDEPESPAESAAPAPDWDGKVSLLTTRERAALASVRSAKWGEQYRWWGDQFMEVMSDLHPVLSEPYYRLNRWLILSMIFANRAVLQSESGDRIILNFYAVMLGPSNSGKSQSLEPVLKISEMFYEGADDPDIGGDATSAGLTQALIRRDGLPSLFHSDEADSILLNWANQNGEFRGMKQRVTEVYAGRVPTLQRTTAKDISGIKATGYLSVHLIGIDDRIADAISPDDWRTGFINRFIFVEGERKYRSDEERRIRIARPGSGRMKDGSSAWYGEWVSKFRVLRSNVGAGGEPAWLDADEDVLDRHVETGKRLEEIARSAPGYADRVDPTLRRLDVYVMKCAALVALSEGRRVIQMSDYRIALEQAEEWATKALEMVRRTDLTPRARQVNRLAELLKQNGGKMTKSAIFRHEAYAGHSKEAEGLIHELEVQRRVEILGASPNLGIPEPVVRLLEAAE